MSKIYILIILPILILALQSDLLSQKIFSCESKYDADVAIFVVESKYDADLLIFFVESKYDVQWRKRSKMHLLF